MSYEDRFIPRTPSRYHDQARTRQRLYPKHDSMQADVLTYLRERILAGVPRDADVERLVEGEYPFVRRGQICGYADAIDITRINFFRTVQIFEVKPVIDTVFGIVRQAKSMLSLAETCIHADAYFCHVVVPHDDPLIAEMKKEWPRTWAWGATFDKEPAPSALDNLTVRHD